MRKRLRKRRKTRNLTLRTNISVFIYFKRLFPMVVIFSKHV